MVINRGDIVWADLRRPIGAQPGYRRPVLVVSSELFNRSRIGTVVAVAITSNLRLAEAPGNVMLPAEASGLDRDSVANVSQIVTLNKSDLSEREFRVDGATVRLIEKGLELVLGLSQLPGSRSPLAG